MSDTLVRTVPIKLDVGANAPALVETARRFNAAATWIARVCWDEGITNTNTAHHRVYGQTRADYGLGAQLAVCARAKAMEAIKAARKTGGDMCPAWRVDAAVRYDARTYRLLPLDGVSLNTVEGRVICRLLPGQRQRDMLLETSWRIGGADLVRRKGVWYLHLTQHKPAPEPDDATGYIGVDLGVARIATTDDGTIYDGAQVTAVRACIAYKALAAGLVVAYVDPRDTSRTCAACGHCARANRRDQSHFLCLRCGHEANADVNAARNIAARAGVNQPIVLPRAGLRLCMASTSRLL